MWKLLPSGADSKVTSLVPTAGSILGLDRFALPFSLGLMLTPVEWLRLHWWTGLVNESRALYEGGGLLKEFSISRPPAEGPRAVEQPCTARDTRSTFGAALSIEHGGQASADILGQNWSDPTRLLGPQWVGPLTWPRPEPTVGHTSMSLCRRTSPFAAASVRPR